MDKEKKIKEMTEVLENCIEQDFCDYVCYEKSAENLVNAGYGDVKKAVKEFAENKVKPIIDELVELLFNDNESNCKVNNCEKGDDIPCGCSICIEENKQVWKSKLDELIKELYSEERQ